MTVFTFTPRPPGLPLQLDIDRVGRVVFRHGRPFVQLHSKEHQLFGAEWSLQGPLEIGTDRFTFPENIQVVEAPYREDATFDVCCLFENLRLIDHWIWHLDENSDERERQLLEAIWTALDRKRWSAAVALYSDWLIHQDRIGESNAWLHRRHRGCFYRLLKMAPGGFRWVWPRVFHDGPAHELLRRITGTHWIETIQPSNSPRLFTSASPVRGEFINVYVGKVEGWPSGDDRPSSDDWSDDWPE